MSKFKFSGKGLAGLFAILAVGVAGYFSFQTFSSDTASTTTDSSSSIQGDSQTAESKSETPIEVPAVQVEKSQPTIQNAAPSTTPSNEGTAPTTKPENTNDQPTSEDEDNTSYSDDKVDPGC